MGLEQASFTSAAPDSCLPFRWGEGHVCEEEGRERLCAFVSYFCVLLSTMIVRVSLATL